MIKIFKRGEHGFQNNATNTGIQFKKKSLNSSRKKNVSKREEFAFIN